jgi:hypothetical protein
MFEVLTAGAKASSLERFMKTSMTSAKISLGCGHRTKAQKKQGQ